jgi:hypothetical protein
MSVFNRLKNHSPDSKTGTKASFISLSFILLWCLASELRAQPVLHNFQTAVGDGTSASVNAPGGIIEGHLLVAGLALEKGNGVTTITPPSGWILIRRTNNNSDCGIATYYKVASASEPATYTFGFSTSGKWSIGITRLSYVSVTSPIDTSSGATGGSGNVTAPSLTTRGPNRRVLCFYTNKKGITFTPDPLSTEIYDAPNAAGGAPSNMMAEFVQNNTGATVARTAVPTNTEKWAAQQLAITPYSLLPVELIDFKAVQCDNKRSACISWTTASETNNDFFTVERSRSGVEWEGIGNTDGAGNSSAPLHYTFEDNSAPSGMVYYRLRQTDFDGTTTVSDPVALLMKPGQEILGFPNPTSRSIRLQGDFPQGVLLVRLMDAAGKLVYDTSMDRGNADESGELNIALPELPAGAYVLSVNTVDGILQQQLRIQLQ